MNIKSGLIRVMTFEEWNNKTKLQKFYSDKEIREIYSGYVKMAYEKNEHIKNYGYGKCNCDICLESIYEMNGFKKDIPYQYKGKTVYIESISPLKYCADYFIKDYHGYYEWINTVDAEGNLMNI